MLDFNKVRDDGVVVALAGPYADHIYNVVIISLLVQSVAGIEFVLSG